MSGISTIASFQKSFDLRQQVAKQGSDLNKASMEVATGLKYDVYEQGRGSAGEALSLRGHIATNQSFLQSNSLLQGRMTATSSSLDSARDIANEFMSFMIAGSISGENREVINSEAQRAIQDIHSRLNSSYAGSFMFSGLATDTKPVTLNADWSTTYNGDTTGNLTNRIEDDISMEWGIRADNTGFTEILDALQVAASTNFSAMSDAAFETLRGNLVSQMSGGIELLTAEQALLGNRQALVDRVVTRQEGLDSLYTESVLDIEGVDVNEAAVRLKGIQNQLEATYNVTARMAEMSFMKYI
jgi:flagellar hook-associated protein 3 FlgL